MPTATNDGVEIAYEIDGPAKGEPVVFVEGLGYGRWMWRAQREAFVDDYRLVLPDNRGTGASDAPEGPYSIEELAGDLDAVLTDAGIDRTHVVGASMGGMIAQQFALEYDRVETLVLLGTTHGGPDAEPIPQETRERLLAVPEAGDRRETIRYRMAPALSDPFVEAHPDLVERIVDWRLESDAIEAARAAQAAAVEGFDASDRLEAIDRPVLLLHGEADRVVPVENAHLLHRALPHSEFVVVEGGSHLFFLEDPEPVNDRLRDFFGRHPIQEGQSRPTTGAESPTNDARSGDARAGDARAGDARPGSSPTDEEGDR